MQLNKVMSHPNVVHTWKAIPRTLSYIIQNDRVESNLGGLYDQPPVILVIVTSVVWNNSIVPMIASYECFLSFEMRKRIWQG